MRSAPRRPFEGADAGECESDAALSPACEGCARRAKANASCPSLDTSAAQSRAARAPGRALPTLRTFRRGDVGYWLRVDACPDHLQDEGFPREPPARAQH